MMISLQWLLSSLAESTRKFGDFKYQNIKEQVVQVVKYFCNNQFAAAAYKSYDGLRLIMPKK